MSWQDDTRIVASPEVLSRVLEGEAVLLDLAAGTYFGLDEVGTRIWELVCAGTTVAELRRVVCAEFDVTPDVAARDLAELLDTLVARGLVRRDERASGA